MAAHLRDANCLAFPRFHVSTCPRCRHPFPPLFFRIISAVALPLRDLGKLSEFQSGPSVGCVRLNRERNFTGGDIDIRFPWTGSLRVESNEIRVNGPLSFLLVSLQRSLYQSRFLVDSSSIPRRFLNKGVSKQLETAASVGWLREERRSDVSAEKTRGAS